MTKGRKAGPTYQELFERVPVALYRTTPEGDILEANQALVELLGYPDRETLQARRVQDLYDDPHQRQDELSLLASRGRLRNHVIRLRRADGKLLWVRDTCWAVKDSRDHVLYYEGSLEDITQVRETEHFATTVIDSVGEGIIVYDRELRYRLWSRTMERLTGLPAEQVLGKGALELFPHLRERGIDRLLKRALTGETVTSPDTPYYVPQTGKTGWVVGTYSPHTTTHGEIIGVVGVIRDVTERKRAEENLKALAEQLQAALQAKETMIQNVSHELRTPLALIMSYSELMIEGGIGSLSQDQFDAATVIYQQALRLHRMVDQLLTLQTFNEQKLKLEPLDPVLLLQQAMLMWREPAAQAGIALRLDAPEALLKVLVDLDYMTQVVDNLLDNAIKFSSQGGIITLKAVQGEKEVILSVIDQGVGIPADQLARIFERFYQVDGSPTRRFRGMGIGLALCQAIVNAHGGRIWAESAGPDQGTSFHVALPLASS